MFLNLTDVEIARVTEGDGVSEFTQCRDLIFCERLATRCDLPPVMYPLAELGCQGGGRSLERLWSGRFIAQ